MTKRERKRSGKRLVTTACHPIEGDSAREDNVVASSNAGFTGSGFMDFGGTARPHSWSRRTGLHRALSRLAPLGLLLAAAACAPAGDAADPGLEDGSFVESENETEKTIGQQSTVYQAESATDKSGCKIATGIAGFTGSGFVDYGGNGTWIEWNNVNAAVAGNYKLTFRYAVGVGSRRSAVLINGVSLGSLPFVSTGAWTTWGAVSIIMPLKAGNNVIRVLADTSTGGPNLDSMELVTDDLCPNDPSKTDPGQCGCGLPEGSCGAASSCVEAAEHKSASLSCPTGQTITSISFASYGTPAGNCTAGFSPGSCHAASSLDEVKALCLGKPSCSVLAGNSLFGDPCRGRFKKLAAVYACSGSSSTDSDQDGTPDEQDGCPNDSLKIAPGECGCGAPEGTCGGSDCREGVIDDSKGGADSRPACSQPYPWPSGKVDNYGDKCSLCSASTAVPYDLFNPDELNAWNMYARRNIGSPPTNCSNALFGANTFHRTSQQCSDFRATYGGVCCGREPACSYAPVRYTDSPDLSCDDAPTEGRCRCADDLTAPGKPEYKLNFLVSDFSALSPFAQAVRSADLCGVEIGTSRYGTGQYETTCARLYEAARRGFTQKYECGVIKKKLRDQCGSLPITP